MNNSGAGLGRLESVYRKATILFRSLLLSNIYQFYFLLTVTILTSGQINAALFRNMRHRVYCSTSQYDNQRGPITWNNTGFYFNHLYHNKHYTPKRLSPPLQSMLSPSHLHAHQIHFKYPHKLGHERLEMENDLGSRLDAVLIERRPSNNLTF